AGAAALAALGLASVTVADSSGWMYRGGFLAVAVLAAVTVASISRSEAGPLGTFLSARPLRWLGRRSYGVYLWHWPVIVLLTRSPDPAGGPRGPRRAHPHPRPAPPAAAAAPVPGPGAHAAGPPTGADRGRLRHVRRRPRHRGRPPGHGSCARRLPARSGLRPH